MAQPVSTPDAPVDLARERPKVVWRRLALLLGPAVAMAFVWQITPLNQLVEPDAMVESLGTLSRSSWGPAAIVVLTVVACALMVPITLLVLAHGALFDAPMSFLVAESSMLLAAVVLYFIGRRAGEGVVDGLLSPALRAQLDNLGAKGVLGLAALRCIPIAHFSLVSMALGGLRIPFSRYFISTVIGQTLMVTLWVVLGQRIRAGLIDPNLRTLGLLFGVLLSVALVASGMRWVSRFRRP